MIILVLIGMLVAPIFTLGCVLIHYNHTILGIIAIIISILVSDDNNDKKQTLWNR